MTIILNPAVIQSVQASFYGSLGTGVGMIVTALIVILLAEVIFYEAVANNQASRKITSFDLALTPLLFILVVMAAVRFAQFMHLI